jgi:hypothetical protein
VNISRFQARSATPKRILPISQAVYTFRRKTSPRIQKSITEVISISRQNIRGQLTTRECLVRGYSSDASFRVFKYGAEVKGFGGNFDFFSPNRDGDRCAEVTRYCDIEIKRCCGGYFASESLPGHVLK